MSAPRLIFEVVAILAWGFLALTSAAQGDWPIAMLQLAAFAWLVRALVARPRP